METQPNATCPCGSTHPECCLPILEGKRKPTTAEELLRARYTAFTLGNIEFIRDTHHPEKRDDVSVDEIREWSTTSEWLGLEIINVEGGQPGDQTAKIAFHARYKQNGQLTEHYELSHFKHDGKTWYFHDAEPLKTETIRREEPKTGRNDPCPCGSGKKFKKCCA